MIIDIKKINEGEESIRIRYIEPNTTVNAIIGILDDSGQRIWGKSDDKMVGVYTKDILFLESVEDKVFAYTKDEVVKIEGSLFSFLNKVADDCFFRCSKAMIINVNKVANLKSLPSNRIDACLENGEHVVISRRYASEFRRFLKGER